MSAPHQFFNRDSLRQNSFKVSQGILQDVVEDTDFLNQLLGGHPAEELKSLNSGRQPPLIEVDDAESHSKEP